MKFKPNLKIISSTLILSSLVGCDYIEGLADYEEDSGPYKVIGTLYNQQTKMYTYDCFHRDPTSHMSSSYPGTLTGWYPDIKPGMRVIVKDSEDKIVSSGSLGKRQEYSKGCYYDFEISVPSGGDFYTVEFGKRGDFFYSEEELKKGDVDITLTIE